MQVNVRQVYDSHGTISTETDIARHAGRCQITQRTTQGPQSGIRRIVVRPMNACESSRAVARPDRDLWESAPTCAGCPSCETRVRQPGDRSPRSRRRGPTRVWYPRFLRDHQPAEAATGRGRVQESGSRVDCNRATCGQWKAKCSDWTFGAIGNVPGKNVGRVFRRRHRQPDPGHRAEFVRLWLAERLTWNRKADTCGLTRSKAADAHTRLPEAVPRAHSPESPR